MARTLLRRRTCRGSPENFAARNANERFERGLGADDPRPEGEHVHVVVLDALVRRIGVVTDGGADAADLVGRHGRTDPGSTDEDPAIDLAVPDRVPEPRGEVGVVVLGIGSVATEVDQLMSPGQPRRSGRATRP